MLKNELLQPRDLEDFDFRHRLEPLDHAKFVRNRVEQLEGVHSQNPELWESTDEVFDEWAVIVPHHGQNRQVNEVLCGEEVENVDRIHDSEIPDDEGGKGGEVNGGEIDIDAAFGNPLRTCRIQRELAQFGAFYKDITEIVE